MSTKKIILIKQYLIFLILLLGVIFWVTLTKDNYFHWDEWGIFSIFSENSLAFLFKPFNEHYIPFNLINHYILLRFFGLNYLPFQLSVIFFHIVSTYVLFKIFLALKVNFKLAIILTLIFLFQSLANENLVWSQGVNITIAGTCIFAAFYFYIKSSPAAYLFLFLSPLGHGLTLLYPWAFAWLAFWQKKSWKPFCLVGLANLAILAIFSFSTIKISVTPQIHDFDQIPKFIITGFLNGNLLRFTLPNLNFFPQSSSHFGPLLRTALFFIFTSTTLIYAIYLYTKKRLFSVAHIIFLYLPFVTINYLAIAPARISQGMDQAKIARYTYPSFFFLLIIISMIIPLLKIRRKITYMLLCSLLILHLISIVNFQTLFWRPMMNRNKLFIDEITYLFKTNSKVYDLTATGINGQIRLSQYWFLYESKDNLIFIPIQNIKDLNPMQMSSDLKSQMIYKKLLTDYQKKYD